MSYTSWRSGWSASMVVKVHSHDGLPLDMRSDPWCPRDATDEQVAEWTRIAMKLRPVNRALPSGEWDRVVSVQTGGE